MDFIKLVRGNIESLEGRVITFSRFERGEFAEKPVVALYSTNQVEDFIKKFELPEDVARDISKNHNDMVAKARAKHQNANVFTYYTAPLLVESEKEIYSGNEDILDVGNYLAVERCLDAVKLGVEFYILQFEKQFLLNGPKNKHEEKISEEVFLNYTLVQKSILGDYISRNFITPLMEYKKQKNDREVQRIGQSFIDFSSGSPFIQDVYEMLGVIEKGDINPVLIKTYLNKIEAINNEDYETAARLRDLIRKSAKNK
jgi:hypothetical protein